MYGHFHFEVQRSTNPKAITDYMKFIANSAPATQRRAPFRSSSHQSQEHGAAPCLGMVSARWMIVMASAASKALASSSVMLPGQWLTANQQLVSPAGASILTMQGDGNLVLSDFTGAILWTTKTGHSPNAKLALQQSDGNLVLYDSSGHCIWQAQTAGKGAVQAQVQDDCNFVVYGAGMRALWATFSQCSAPPPKPTQQCDVPGQFPAGHSPALQAQRPPQQTDEQAKLLKRVTSDAVGKSANARTAVGQLVQEALKEIANDQTVPAEIRRMGVDEMLDLLTWEFMRLPLTHNAPLKDAAAINDDTKMTTTLTNGYLQNVAQRYLLGVESKSNLIGESQVHDLIRITMFSNL